MGFLKNPQAFLLVLRDVLEISNYRFILFSAGYEPLDAAIQMIAGGSSNSNELQHSMCSKSGTLLFNNRLFCFSGQVFLLMRAGSSFIPLALDPFPEL